MFLSNKQKGTNFELSTAITMMITTAEQANIMVRTN